MMTPVPAGGCRRSGPLAVTVRVPRRPDEALQPGGTLRPAAAVRTPRQVGVEPTVRDAGRQLFAVQAGGEGGSYARALHGPILPEVRGAGSAAGGREVRGAR